MGSYGDRWLRCTWCEKWGKCLWDLPPDITPLLDVDGIGVLCDPCYDRGHPPQYDYIQRLLRAKLGKPAVCKSGLIADFVYKACADQTAHTAWCRKYLERRIAADNTAYTYTEFVAWYRTHADQMWERAAATEHSHSRTSLVATHALSAPEPEPEPPSATENAPYSAADTPVIQLPHRQATEPTTPNGAATEPANDDNTEPRGCDATEHAAIHSHVEWHNDTPHATTVGTQTPSTCDLCKGPGIVETWHENAGTIEICSSTWIMHVSMFRQTYAYAVQVCHNCYEACPYTTQEELRIHAMLQGDAKQMVALLRAIFVAWTLPSIAAHKITDYLFPLVADGRRPGAATEHASLSESLLSILM